MDSPSVLTFLWVGVVLLPLVLGQVTAIVEMISYFRWSEGYYRWGLREADPQVAARLPSLGVGVTLDGLEGKGRMVAYRGKGRSLYFHRPGIFGRRLRAIGVIDFDEAGAPTLRWSPFPKVAMWFLCAFFLLAAISGYFVEIGAGCFFSAFAVIFPAITLYNIRASKKLVDETMLPELLTILEAYLRGRPA